MGFGAAVPEMVGNVAASATASSVGWKPPLTIAMKQWFQRLPGKAVVAFCDFVRSKTFGPVGTACSGSDMLMVVLATMQDYAKQELDLDLVVEQSFACEILPEKQAFLQSVHKKLGVLFEDAAGLSRPKLANLVTGREEVVPWSYCFAAGFSCVTHARNNMRAKSGSKHGASTKGCVEKSEGKTGESYSHIRGYIQNVRPPLVLLENVPSLLEENDKSSDLCDSDAQYIVNDLATLGYKGRWFRVKADAFGSIVPRDRIYFVGFAQKAAGHNQDFRLDFIQECLDAMKFPENGNPLMLEHFLSGTTALESTFTNAMPDRVTENRTSTQPFFKAAKTTPLYMDEHISYYEIAGLPWPPRRGADECFSSAERAFQIAVLFAKHFPHPLPNSTTSFVDLNPSMRVTCSMDKNGSLRNPWKPRPGCLVSNNQILMRWLPDDVRLTPGSARPRFDQWKYRLLCGVELMALIGWCHSLWPVDSALPSHQLLTSLAGNAFSGFAVAPVMVATLASLGLPDAHTICCEDDNADSDGSGEYASSCEPESEDCDAEACEDALHILA